MCFVLTLPFVIKSLYQPHVTTCIPPGILNTWIGNGSVIYVSPENHPYMDSELVSLLLTQTRYDMDADPSGRVSGV